MGPEGRDSFGSGQLQNLTFFLRPPSKLGLEATLVQLREALVIKIAYGEQFMDIKSSVAYQQAPLKALPKPQATPPQQEPEQPDPQETVTFDASKGCYHFERPGLHETKCLNNPFTEGGTVAAVVGAPLLLGAAQADLFGTLGAVGVTTLAGPALGLGIGGALAGYGAHKMSRGNPVFTALGAVAGGAVGAVAFPVSQYLGTALGYQGSLIAAGALGVGAAIYTAVNNHSVKEEAIKRGYTPQ